MPYGVNLIFYPSQKEKIPHYKSYLHVKSNNLLHQLHQIINWSLFTLTDITKQNSESIFNNKEQHEVLKDLSRLFIHTSQKTSYIQQGQTCEDNTAKELSNTCDIDQQKQMTIHFVSQIIISLKYYALQSCISRQNLSTHGPMI